MNALQPRVIVLSGQSLFAEGIAARLSAQLGQQLVTINVREPAALQRVIQANPVAVILDATDGDVARACPLSGLLDALPGLKIIRLNSENDQIQVVSSQQRQAWQMQDLVKFIE